MKKSIKIAAAILVVAMSAFSVYYTITNNEISDIHNENLEALADGDINPDCPNGCVEGDGGCDCHGHHDCLAEAKSSKKMRLRTLATNL